MKEHNQNHGLKGLKDDTELKSVQKKSVQSVQSNKSVIQTMEEKGFKQTDLGLIPDDWGVMKLGEIAEVGSGGTPFRGNLNFWNGDIPWITTTQIDFNLITDANEFITKLGLENSATKFVSKGTLLMAMYGQGKTRGKVAILGIDATINQACASIKISKEYLSDYIFLNLASRYDEIRKLSNSGSQENLSGNLIKDILIPLPPTKAEQTLIATALSDADALISSLEKLIAKKQNIKQGAMSRLLGTPKKDWVVKKLGELGKPFGGLSGKSKVDFEKGMYPYIPFMNIMSNPIIDTTYFDYVNIGLGESQHQALKGDLFFNGSSETPEEVGMCSVLLDEIPNLYLNSFCFGFRLNKELKTNGLYLSYYFRSSEGRKLFYSLAQGATRYNLSKSNFMKMEIEIPNPEEQTYIATILTDMDAEITVLEKKLEKQQRIKQGMMQNLLTGKIRLNQDLQDGRINRIDKTD